MGWNPVLKSMRQFVNVSLVYVDSFSVHSMGKGVFENKEQHFGVHSMVTLVS